MESMVHTEERMQDLHYKKEEELPTHLGLQEI